MTDPMTGIRSIRLAPTTPATGVSDELRDELRAGGSLHAGVGYWTLRHTDFPGLAPALDESGFLCVDLSLPTSVDRLSELHSAGANVYLHLEQTTSSSSWEGPVPRMPNGLMHTKLLLFDRPDGTARLWCGSHNWTSRALGGLNIEASLVVDLDQGCELHRTAAAFLLRIRDAHCSRFDPELIEWYRWLQRNKAEHTVRVVRLSSATPDTYLGETITLFGDQLGDLKALPPTTGDLLVEILGTTSEDRVVYTAEVLDKGKLEGADSSAGGLTFHRRHHAYRRAPRIPRIQSKARPSPQKVARSTFYVTLHLTKRLEQAARTRPPLVEDRWVEAPDRLGLRKLDDWYWAGLLGRQWRPEQVAANKAGRSAGPAEWSTPEGLPHSKLARLVRAPASDQVVAACMAALQAGEKDVLESESFVLRHVVVGRDDG